MFKALLIANNFDPKFYEPDDKIGFENLDVTSYPFIFECGFDLDKLGHPQSSSRNLFKESVLNSSYPVSIFTDKAADFVTEAELRSPINVAWLLEPPCWAHAGYEFVARNPDKFDLVFTYHEQFLASGWPHVKLCEHGTYFVDPPERGLFSKNKLLSMVGNVTYYENPQLPGHLLRQHVVERFGDKFSKGGLKHGGEHERKLKYLQDFRYHIAIENTKFDFYFTEKIQDCFMTGTIPIYWGCPSILQFGFDPNGIISFDTLDELNDIIENVISPEDYERRLQAIKFNYEHAKKYPGRMWGFANQMWNNGLKELYEKKILAVP